MPLVQATHTSCHTLGVPQLPSRPLKMPGGSTSGREDSKVHCRGRGCADSGFEEEYPTSVAELYSRILSTSNLYIESLELASGSNLEMFGHIHEILNHSHGFVFPLVWQVYRSF